MTPGMITPAHRGGVQGNRLGPVGFPGRLGFVPTNRAFAARPRFAVTPDPDTGGTSVHLDDNEVATVAVDADGNTTITIENKPGTEPPASPEPAPPAEPAQVETNLRGVVDRVARSVVSFTRSSRSLRTAHNKFVVLNSDEKTGATTIELSPEEQVTVTGADNGGATVTIAPIPIAEPDDTLEPAA